MPWVTTFVVAAWLRSPSSTSIVSLVVPSNSPSCRASTTDRNLSRAKSSILCEMYSRGYNLFATCNIHISQSGKQTRIHTAPEIPDHCTLIWKKSHVFLQCKTQMSILGNNPNGKFLNNGLINFHQKNIQKLIDLNDLCNFAMQKVISPIVLPLRVHHPLHELHTAGEPNQLSPSKLVPYKPTWNLNPTYKNRPPTPSEWSPYRISSSRLDWPPWKHQG